MFDYNNDLNLLSKHKNTTTEAHENICHSVGQAHAGLNRLTQKCRSSQRSIRLFIERVKYSKSTLISSRRIISPDSGMIVVQLVI